MIPAQPLDLLPAKVLDEAKGGVLPETSESYTAARAQLIRKKTALRPSPATASATASNRADATAPDPAKVAGLSDEAVRSGTGKSWAQWVRLLDAIDAATLPHRDIAAHLREVHQIGGWWAQGVTVGYERIKGLREKAHEPRKERIE